MAADRSWKSAGLDAGAYAMLARELPASRLWSLLLDVMEQRAAQRDAGALMEQWQHDRFVQPSYMDQRTLVALDAELLAAAAAFEAIELSPLAPLGTCSTMGRASQNKVVAAVRGTEVVSDPTNVMALECARRLRADATQTIRLATSHRAVRAQAVPKQPGFAAHFRIFCLASAAREQQDHAFTVAALTEHITTMVAAFDRLERHGYTFPDRAVTILATPGRAVAADRIAAAVPGVPVTREALDHPYYSGGLRFQIRTRAIQGAQIPLVDGGAFDWVGTLASNNRVVFVATGLGAQIVPLLFRRSG
jgi:hypothetical protein